MGRLDLPAVFGASHPFQHSHSTIVVGFEWRYSKILALAGSDWMLVFRAQSRRSLADGSMREVVQSPARCRFGARHPMLTMLLFRRMSSKL